MRDVSCKNWTREQLSFHVLQDSLIYCPHLRPLVWGPHTNERVGTIKGRFGRGRFRPSLGPFWRWAVLVGSRHNAQAVWCCDTCIDCSSKNHFSPYWCCNLNVVLKTLFIYLLFITIIIIIIIMQKQHTNKVRIRANIIYYVTFVIIGDLLRLINTLTYIVIYATETLGSNNRQNRDTHM